MKRLDLVQLCIILVGICTVYLFLEMLPMFFSYLYSWFTEGLKGGFYMEQFIIKTLMSAGYLIFSILCIGNSKQLAHWVANKASLEADINFNINKTELLFAAFVVIAIYGLIRDI
ncbi:MAG TPA: hypothetical protein VKH37_00890, partial [Ferruginibacter sp.]|nr:hypothetical protein [Ferruginibacter sp.]